MYKTEIKYLYIISEITNEFCVVRHDRHSKDELFILLFLIWMFNFKSQAVSICIIRILNPKCKYTVFPLD